MKSSEILIFIFIIGFLFFNWPLLALFGKEVIVYLFAFWFLFIIIIVLVTTKKERE